MLTTLLKKERRVSDKYSFTHQKCILFFLSYIVIKLFLAHKSLQIAWLPLTLFYPCLHVCQPSEPPTAASTQTAWLVTNPLKVKINVSSWVTPSFLLLPHGWGPFGTKRHTVQMVATSLFQLQHILCQGTECQFSGENLLPGRQLPGLCHLPCS